jgi:Pyruvate dehydrogenase complex, dehydrogenase (E1) component
MGNRSSVNGGKVGWVLRRPLSCFDVENEWSRASTPSFVFVAFMRTALPGLLTQYFDFHVSLIIPPNIHNYKADSVSPFEKKTTVAFAQSYNQVLKKKN